MSWWAGIILAWNTFRGQLETLELLLGRDDLEVANTNALSVAAASGHEAVAERLLDVDPGPDINRRAIATTLDGRRYYGGYSFNVLSDSVINSFD